VLTEQQQQDLRELITSWHQENRGQRYASFISITDYLKARAQAPKAVRDRNQNILSLIKLDPLSNLDPATQALQETRHFAQRTMYYFQRMPTLIRWQTEMLALELVTSPAGQQVLEDLHGYRETANHLTRVIEAFPNQVAAAQKDILIQLAEENTRLSRLAEEFKATFEAGTSMAVAVREATEAIENLAGTNDPKPDATAQPASPASPATDSHPFDVREYGAAASEIARASLELRGAIDSLNQLARSDVWQQRSVEVAAMIDRAEAGGERVLTRAVLWSCLLIVVALAGLVLSLILYRRMTRKWIQE
jgi:hypothetical protein